ncbi:hypothetical protein RN001_003613 [Aquatica leii]|uniref:Myb/SANT-like DNA-binding domain-containing protein n=1 Tax=Aquatica leii TaxID=1421715 RepID=A0AAN7SKW1_9COLE|nr:hypothetical protein RN001_003613 [Aquatica leii]
MTDLDENDEYIQVQAAVQSVTDKDRNILFQNIKDGSLIYIAPQSSSQPTDWSENVMSPEEALLPESTKVAPRTWCRNATLMLINLYSQYENMFKSTTIKNDSVWQLIEIEMKKQNFNYNANQCKHKFKYLKIRYTKKMIICGAIKIVVQLLKNSSSWRRWMKSTCDRSSSRGSASATLQPTDDCLEEDITNDGPLNKKQKKKKTKDDELLNYVKESANKKEECRTKRQNEMLEMQRASINTFKSVMEKFMEKL